MFLPSSNKANRRVALAALGLGAGEVLSLLRQQVISAVATALAIAAVSGLVALH